MQKAAIPVFQGGHGNHLNTTCVGNAGWKIPIEQCLADSKAHKYLIVYSMSCGNFPFVCALCTLFHMVSCLRENMENVMQLDDMQSRSYLGSYLDVLKGLHRIDECDEMEPAEKSKCSERQVVSAFSKDLQEKNCEGTKPKFQQTASTADSGDTEKMLQELCEAAIAVNSGDPREEEEGKTSMNNTLQTIKTKMKTMMEKIKEPGAKAIRHLIAEDFYFEKILDFFNVNISDASAHPLSLLGEGVELMSDVVQGQVSGKQVALFALKATKLALKIGGSVIPFPGNVLAAKLVDLGIQKLSEESAEALEDTIDRIATVAVGRALKIQALREAKIFVDYAEQQIHFHDSLDDGFAHLEGIDGQNSGKNFSTLFAVETAFNRWLIIENSLAAALHRLVPPERPDARRKEDLRSLQTVEERAEFFVVVVDHFLLYLLVLSKMAEKVQMEGPQHKLHNSLQERAREMAKLILPSLAVMFEKEWGNPWVSMFYKPDPEYEDEAFGGSWKTGFPEYWWSEPTWKKQRGGRRRRRQLPLKKFEAFNRQKESINKKLYDKNTEALADKLKDVLNNKLLYPQELQQSKWCRSLTDLDSFHHGARAGEFILKCLFYPLSNPEAAQQIMAFRMPPEEPPIHNLYNWDRLVHWNFRPDCASASWLSMYAELPPDGGYTEFGSSMQGLHGGVWGCGEDKVISDLRLETKSTNTWAVKVKCERFHGLHKINNSGYTFESFEMEVEELTFQVPCARDYAVLEKVEYHSEEKKFKTTCRYAYLTNYPECKKPSSQWIVAFSHVQDTGHGEGAGKKSHFATRRLSCDNMQKAAQCKIQRGHRTALTDRRLTLLKSKEIARSFFLWILAQSGMSTWAIWTLKDVEFWNVPPVCHSPFDNLGWLSAKCSSIGPGSTGSGSTHAISEIFPWQIEPPHWKMAKTSRCKDAKGRTSPTFLFKTEKKTTTSQSQTGHRYALLKLDIVKYYHCCLRLLRQRRSRPFQLESEAGCGSVGSGRFPCWFVGGTRQVELNCSHHHMHGLILRLSAARNSRIKLQNIQLEWKNLESRDSSSGCTQSTSLYRFIPSLSPEPCFIYPNQSTLMHP